MVKINIIELICSPYWMVGLIGSGVLMGFFIPKAVQGNQLILGMLIGMVMTIIAFTMSIYNLNSN